jgi:uncharacterized protein Yka (UPF0111/DUF47 family)
VRTGRRLGGLFHNRYLLDLLRAEAELTATAFSLMLRALQNQGLCGRGGFRRIERLWRRAARIDRLLTIQLKRTVITPLDAEDIRALSSNVTGILESLREAAWEQAGLPAASIPELLTSMYESAYDSSRGLLQAVVSLPQEAAIADFARELSGNRRKVKQFQRQLVAALMEQADPVRILAWKHVYDWPLAILVRFHKTACGLQRTRLKNN